MPEQKLRLFLRAGVSFLSALSLFLFCAFQVPGEIRISWITPTEHHFGDIPQGEAALFGFALRNEGTEPLVIDNVRPACGCTTPDWPREAISPGDTATINVRFNARQKGYFYKLIKVYFKGRAEAEKLHVEGYVL